ncbi:tetratricopeptide repeat-containing sensor histidine kinase [Owenweeksia hongkongensis]|uniref:tetratricopeptide repeat-containing sensor histidine kinase n=1 Tax=Owenweeksia hongkongensis TaxID=253245 RepID=UPI003A8E2BF2
MPRNGSFIKFFFLAFIVFKICPAQVISSKSIDSINLLAFNLRYEYPDSALKLNLALHPYLNHDIDSLIVAKVFSVSGTLHMIKGDYQKAQEYHFRCLRIREAVNEHVKVGHIQKNIANTYYYLQQYDKAKEFHKKSISNITDSVEIAYAYNDIGAVYASEGLNDSAFFFFKRALKMLSPKKEVEDVQLADLYSNVGYYFEENGHLDSAIHYYQQAESIYQQYHEVANQCWIQHHLGIVKELKKNYKAAALDYRGAMKLASHLGDTEQQKELVQSLLRVHSKMGNSDSTLFYLGQFIFLNDSINQLKTAKNIQEVETKYEVEKKDQALKLSQETNARINAESTTNKYVAYGLLGLLLLTGLTTFILIRNYSQKQYISSMELNLKNQKINELLQEHESASYAALLEGQEIERQRIARDLHDSLGGTLAALKLGLYSSSPDAKENNIELAKLAMAEVRSISHNLANGVLEKHGLSAALQDLKALIDNSGSINFKLTLDAKTFDLGLKKEIELYRIIQELTSNTLKYAHAKNITLTTQYMDDEFILNYADDGRGFDMENVKKGLGLSNLKHRLEQINASFHLATCKGKGAAFTIEVLNS